MKKLLAKIAATLFISLLFAGSASNVAAQSAGTLYKRVGGYDAIAAVTDDFIGRLASDKQLARFFGGVSADSQKKLRQHVDVARKFCRGAGTSGPRNDPPLQEFDDIDTGATRCGTRLGMRRMRVAVRVQVDRFPGLDLRGQLFDEVGQVAVN